MSFTKHLFNGILLLALLILLALTWRHFYRPTLPEPQLHVDIKTWKQPSGLKVFLVEDHAIAMVDIALGFRTGAVHDGDQPGLAVATASLMDKGTSDLTASQIAERFASIGAQFSSQVSEEITRFSLRSMTRADYLEPALTLFHQIITQPQFPQSRLADYQKEVQSYFSQAQEKPSYHAKMILKKTLYGRGAYAGDLHGTPRSIVGLRSQDLRQFAKKHYVTNEASLVIVGDYTKQEAEQLVERLERDLSVGEVTEITPPLAPKKVESIHKIFSSTQTAVLLGLRLDLSPTDPDYFPLLVGNELFGAPSLSSRLMQEVREKRGLVYGIVSLFSTTPGQFTIRFLTQNDNVDETIDVTRETLRSFLQQPIQEKALQAAKLSMMRQYLVATSTNRSVMARLLGIWQDRLPENWINDRNQKIAAVTAEQVQAAWRKHIRPEALTLVRVGGDAKNQ